MQGSIKRRYRGSWSVILEMGYQVDPKTGKMRRRQKWVTVRGTRRDAERRCAELVRDINRGEFVDRSPKTVAQWLREWLDKAIRPPAKRASTYSRYRHVIDTRLIPAFGAVRLQDLKASDVKRYYVEQRDTLAPATLAQHHAILTGALKAAMIEGLLIRNVASLVIGKPQARRDHDALSQNVWTADEARTFLTAAKTAGPQPAALFALALDSGARKNELCGLQWSDVDLEKGTLTIVRQLVTTGRHPEFGPTKNGAPRSLDLGQETVSLLREHKRHQAELKMANRAVYQDLGLLFAKEWGHLHGREDSLGLPLQSNNLGQREFARIITAAKVRPITFHGLRHTSATLMLQAGIAPQVVQQRLGHKRIEITLGIYAHALPSMQQDAARRLGALLHG